MLDSSVSPRDLALMLGTSLQKISHLAYAQGMTSQYQHFQINKKNGGKRQISAPNKKTKQLQYRLKVLLEEIYTPHPAATAFIEKRGILYNASKHTKKAAVFNIDLNNFYGEIHFGRVRGLLMAKPYLLRKDTAQLIAHLCCLNQTIPQGAPTSPVISNMICLSMDRQLSLLAKNYRAYYSRYADDITFSFRTFSKNQIVDSFTTEALPTAKLENIISRNGFSINTTKTRMQTFKERQLVTGLKVNEKVNVDRRYIRTTRAMIHALHGGARVVNAKYFKGNKNDPKDDLAPMVAGRLNFIGMIKGIDSSVYQGLASKFNSLELSIKVKSDPYKKSQKDFSIAFFKRENRARLERCVWVVTFDGIPGISFDGSLVQGTAFVIEGGRILTASHIFKKAGDPKYCFLHRISSPGKKYKARIVKENTTLDIAELSFSGKKNPEISHLELTKNEHINTGYEVAVVGFPQLLSGHKSVSIKRCHIVNTFTRSTFDYKEVDADIQGGNSGGPVVDGYMNVVGMATMGVAASFSQEASKASIESRSSSTVPTKPLAKRILKAIGKLFSKDKPEIVTRNEVTKIVRDEINSTKSDVTIEGTNAFVSSKHFSDFR